jgi:hypothetical protein
MWLRQASSGGLSCLEKAVHVNLKAVQRLECAPQQRRLPLVLLQQRALQAAEAAGGARGALRRGRRC